VYQVQRRAKQGSAFKLEKYDKVNDLIRGQTDDEEKLIAHFQKKMDEKVKLQLSLKEKQERLEKE